MEAATPETLATNAECAIPFNAEPEELENEEFSKEVSTVLDYCDQNLSDYREKLSIAHSLISDVTEEFETDILTYVEEAAESDIDIDPFVIANTSGLVERLRVASESLSAVLAENDQDDDEEFDEEELTD